MHRFSVHSLSVLSLAAFFHVASADTVTAIVTSTVIRSDTPVLPVIVTSTVTRSHPPVSTATVVPIPAAAEYLRFAVFGDSYASGVSYGDGCPLHCKGREGFDYDYGDPDEIRRCRRITDTYAYGLKNDVSGPVPWAKGRTPYLDWPACSGAHFVQAQEQAEALFQAQNASGKASQLATLQIGGNDALFAEVVMNCFFQPDGKDACKRDYGQPWPDQKGDCADAMADAIDKILKPQYEYSKELVRTFDKILTADAVKADPNFHLYVLGYPEFFNDKTTTCDEVTWSEWSDWPTLSGRCEARDKYKVNQSLRRQTNEVVNLVNTVLANETRNYAARDPRISFVPVSQIFEGHRFCEEGAANGYEGAWFWRGPHLSDFVAGVSEDDKRPFFNDTTQLDPLQVLQCGNISEPSVPAPWDAQLVCDLAARGQPIAPAPLDGHSESSGPGGGGVMDRGEILRTFHPTKEGHAAIEKVLSQVIWATFKG